MIIGGNEPATLAANFLNRGEPPDIRTGGNLAAAHCPVPCARLHQWLFRWDSAGFRSTIVKDTEADLPVAYESVWVRISSITPFRHQLSSSGNLGRLLNTGENRWIAIAPYVVDRRSLNQPSFPVSNQFDVIAVFHEVVP